MHLFLKGVRPNQQKPSKSALVRAIFFGENGVTFDPTAGIEIKRKSI
jgi:hypothetical protein